MSSSFPAINWNYDFEGEFVSFTNDAATAKFHPFYSNKLGESCKIPEFL